MWAMLCSVAKNEPWPGLQEMMGINRRDRADGIRKAKHATSRNPHVNRIYACICVMSLTHGVWARSQSARGRPAPARPRCCRCGAWGQRVDGSEWFALLVFFRKKKIKFSNFLSSIASSTCNWSRKKENNTRGEISEQLSTLALALFTTRPVSSLEHPCQRKLIGHRCQFLAFLTPTSHAKTRAQHHR